MKIHEYQGKKILKKFKVPIQDGYTLDQISEAENTIKKVQNDFNTMDVIVKAQIHAGGRGKGGGVKYSANFDSVPSGDYFALAGSDTDGDGLICGPFEACGAFQSLGDLKQITSAEVNFAITYSLFAPFPSGQFAGCN